MLSLHLNVISTKKSQGQATGTQKSTQPDSEV